MSRGISQEELGEIAKHAELCLASFGRPIMQGGHHRPSLVLNVGEGEEEEGFDIVKLIRDPDFVTHRGAATVGLKVFKVFYKARGLLLLKELIGRKFILQHKKEFLMFHEWLLTNYPLETLPKGVTVHRKTYKCPTNCYRGNPTVVQVPDGQFYCCACRWAADEIGEASHTKKIQQPESSNPIKRGDRVVVRTSGQADHYGHVVDKTTNRRYHTTYHIELKTAKAGPVVIERGITTIDHA